MNKVTKKTTTYLLCGDAERPCEILETRDRLMAGPGPWHKVILLDVSTPGLSVTWQHERRIVRRPS